MHLDALHLVRREPRDRLRLVVVGTRLARDDLAREHDRDEADAITVRVRHRVAVAAEDAQHLADPHDDPRLLEALARGGLVRGLARIDRAAGNLPPSLDVL